MSIDYQYLEDQVPPYLVREKKEGFLKELKSFLDGKKIPYFTRTEETQWLQGDGAVGLPIVDVVSLEKLQITGIIISNTCDMSPDNQRDIPGKVSFAPLISLSRYADALARSGISAERIDSKINSVRAQRVTNLLFLPQGQGLEEDSIALLDDVHSMPRHLLPEVEHKRVFSLSQIGHYLLLFKISIHFCRFHEGLDRAQS